MFQPNRTLGQRNRPWRGNLCPEHLLQLWTAPSSRRTGRECRHRPEKFTLY